MSEEFDLEALQAQIDLSNSVTYDIVSSWMKPRASTSKESVSDAVAKELEEYARRPQRLGLGASVSKSTAITSHEGAKLKGKLIGRKRPREDEAASVSTIGKSNEDNSDENEESRSSAIGSRKLQVTGILPFGNGKTKQKNKGAGSSVAFSKAETNPKAPGGSFNTSPNPKPNPFKVPKTPPPPPLASKEEFRPPVNTSDQVDGPSPSKKRRKKNRKKRQDADKTNQSEEEEEEWKGFGDAFITVEDLDDSISGSRQPSIAPPPSTTIMESSPESTAKTVIPSTSPKKSAPTDQSVDGSPPKSILNLHGPPPIDESLTTSPRKKRRNRRKKNKNNQVAETT